jgi:hypothetical protein
MHFRDGHSTLDVRAGESTLSFSPKSLLQLSVYHTLLRTDRFSKVQIFKDKLPESPTSTELSH